MLRKWSGIFKDNWGSPPKKNKQTKNNNKKTKKKMNSFEWILVYLTMVVVMTIDRMQESYL